MHWGQQQFRKTVLLNPRYGNVGSIYTVSGHAKYQAFCADLDIQEDELITADSPSEEEDCNAELTTDSEGSQVAQNTPELPPTTDFEIFLQEDKMTDFGSVEAQDSNQPEADMANFLRWHLRLGHASPAKIKALAKQRILP